MQTPSVVDRQPGQWYDHGWSIPTNHGEETIHGRSRVYLRWKVGMRVWQRSSRKRHFTKLCPSIRDDQSFKTPRCFLWRAHRSVYTVSKRPGYIIRPELSVKFQDVFLSVLVFVISIHFIRSNFLFPTVSSMLYVDSFRCWYRFSKRTIELLSPRSGHIKKSLPNV
jgi:hypothetical protein